MRDARLRLGAARAGARRLSPPETLLLFVRHGESEANAAKVFAGQSESPLTDVGRHQAEAVAAALAARPVGRVVASDLGRARETAEAIARPHGLPVEVYPELREIDTGEMTGRTWDDEVRAEGFVRWPGGESLEDVLGRALPCVTRLVRESPGATIVIVGHGGVTRILVSHFLGLLPELDRTPGGNANLTVVASDGERFRVERLFDRAHLDSPS